MNDYPVSLIITADTIDTYCLDLVRRLPSVEKRVAALDSLRTFLAVQIGTADQAGPGYTAIRERLDFHFDRARSDLHHQQMGLLVDALRQQQLTRIREIYQGLSRDAFWQLMLQAQHELGHESSEVVKIWSTAWLDNVETLSAELSPYPDTIDFKAVGIEVADYSVMQDVARCFAIDEGR